MSDRLPFIRTTAGRGNDSGWPRRRCVAEQSDRAVALPIPAACGSQLVGPGFDEAAESLVLRLAAWRRLVLPFACADLPVVAGLGPDDLGAVASWMD